MTIDKSKAKLRYTALALFSLIWTCSPGLSSAEDLYDVLQASDLPRSSSDAGVQWIVDESLLLPDPEGAENRTPDLTPDWESGEEVTLPGQFHSSVVTEHPDDHPGFDLSWYQEHENREEKVEFRWKAWEHFTKFVEKPHKPLVHLSTRLVRGKHDGTVFTDPENSWLAEHPIGIQPIMDRPPLPLGEFGEKFLGPGAIQEGHQLPGGAVWRPALWIFGSNRLGVSYRNDRVAAGSAPGAPAAQGRKFGSVVNRLNLFSQLNLTGTEHALIALRPTDQEVGTRPLITGREFSSYFWRESTVPGGQSFSSLSGTNLDFQSAYFEGQLDEILPFLDPHDTRFLDYGFSVGRQAMSFQRGLMANEDMIDAVTVTRNTIYGKGNLNMRVTGIFAWNQLTRITPPASPGGEITGPNTDAKMYAIITETDFHKATVNFDIGFVDDPDPAHGDLLVIGASSTQRLVGYHNTYNTRFHALASFATSGERNSSIIRPMGTVANISGNGQLLFSQVSWTPHEAEDLIYWNTFVAIDQFTSLTRAPQAGPLGDTGILFAAAGLGLYGPALATVSTSSVGSAVGYQMFFDTKEKQLIWEVGVRNGKDADDLEGAVGFQYQQAIKQNWIFLTTGFLSGRQNTSGLSQGIRTEIQLFF